MQSQDVLQSQPAARDMLSVDERERSALIDGERFQVKRIMPQFRLPEPFHEFVELPRQPGSIEISIGNELIERSQRRIRIDHYRIAGSLTHAKPRQQRNRSGRGDAGPL